MDEGECPCELLDEGKCKQSGTLMVILPKVSVGGIYQIRTSSFNSIVDVNSGLDYVQALLGRFALVPLTLRRVKTETHHDEKKQNHYTLQIIFDGDIDTLNKLRSNNERILSGPRYQLPAPVEQNPELDSVDIIVDEEDMPPEILGNDVEQPEPTPPPEKKKAGDAPPKVDEPLTDPQRKKLWAMMLNEKMDKDLAKQFYDYMQPETKAGASRFIERFEDIFKLWNGSVYDVECSTGEMVALNSCIKCKDIKTCQQLISWLTSSFDKTVLAPSLLSQKGA